ncbi:PQQ-binding-like beta-propeller repeat protein [Nubsella zeaxanthinifaciens]|uniref:outer membrane protein assembly factor BamB family protein n=1 Tax=Nubsella zeaxanthinifaciens TaxID=392412 RepID=UPI003CFC3052
MKKIIITLTLAGLCVMGYAQRNPDNIIDLKNQVQEVKVHQITGVPIASTNESYFGLNPNTNDILWTVKRSLLQKLSNLTDTGEDFFEVILTPYVIINNNLVDVRSGKLVIDTEADKVKQLKKYDTMLPQGVLFIEGNSEGSKMLYCVDLAKNEVRWRTKIGNTSALKEAIKESLPPENPFASYELKTLFTKGGNFIYKTGKHLLSLNGTTGQIAWDLEVDPGEAFFNDDESRLVVVKNRENGIMSMVKSSMSEAITGRKIFGKEIKGIDPQSGKIIYEIKLSNNYKFAVNYGDKFFVASLDGANFYDFATGEKKMKKDFAERRIQDVFKNNEGYLISYKNKQMLIDDTGKELWKKPIEIEDVNDDVDYNKYVYKNGYIIAYNGFIGYYTPGQKKPVWKIGLDEEYCRLAYDGLHNNILLLDKEKFYIVNPDVSIEKPKPFKIDLKNNGMDFTIVNIKPNSYFFSSPFEFFITDISGKVIKQKFYKEPGALLRHLTNAGNIALSAASAYNYVAGATNINIGFAESIAGNFSPPGQAEELLRRSDSDINKGLRQLTAASAFATGVELLSKFGGSRFNAFKASNEYAYYFTKGEGGQKLLIRVSKETGEETDKLIFLNNKPIYEVDMVTNKVYYQKGTEVQVFNNK